MALFRKFFYKKPPDGLLEISERVYVFDYCFTTDVLEDDEYKVYIRDVVAQVRDYFPEASYMVFNVQEGMNLTLVADLMTEYDITVVDYPRHYEGCPLLPMEEIYHFLKSSESWLSLGHRNVVLMHCERGGWPVLAFMLSAFLLYRKQYNGEKKTLDMIYKQAPSELLQLMSPLNPIPSQLRYLQYVTRRNVGSQWPPQDRPLTLDCVILRTVPGFDGDGGCRPIFRIYGQDPLMVAYHTPEVLFSSPKKLVRHYNKADCQLVKIDIHCHIQGDVVVECISLDDDLEREEMMFRVMFHTTFLRSNILMLNRDDIDMLWNCKDRFSTEFRAELLFSEMDAAATPHVSNEVHGFEEIEGLPIEAFAKVQEFFSSVDWLDANTDIALDVLQQIATSNVLQEKLDPSSPICVESGNASLKLVPKIFKMNPESEDSENCTRSPTSMAKLKQFMPTLRLSIDVNSARRKIEPRQQLHIALQLSAPSKIISQRTPPTSLSAPVSYCNSLQGSPKPISRYHSAPSALGITALLHYHGASNNEEVANPVTVSPPASVAPLPSASSVPNFIPSVSHNITGTLEGSIPRPNLSRFIPVTPPPPRPLSLGSPVKDQLSLETIHSSHSQHLVTKFKGSLPTSCPLPSLSSSETSSSTSPPPLPQCPSSKTALSSPVNDSFSPPLPPPPPPPSLIIAPSAVNGSISTPLPPPPPPSERAPSSSFGDSSSTPPPPPSERAPSSILGDSSSTPPPPPSERAPSSSLGDASSTPPPPPPPPDIGSSSTGLLSSPLPVKTSAISDPPPPPSPPPHSCSGSSTPPPPPPPLRSLSVSSIPPPPPPLLSRSASSTAPPPPPLLSRSASSTAPPPPPPGLVPKDSSSKNSAVAPPAPPHSNGNAPPVPGPPSAAPFLSKGRTISRLNTRSSSLSGKSNLKPYHWLKITRAMQGSLWDEAQKSGEASKAPEIDISELEKLFSVTSPTGRKGGKLSRRSKTPKPEKVQLIDLRRAYNCEIMLSKVKIPLPDLMSSVLALDDPALDVDQVDNLIKFCPTKEEMELLKNYNGDMDKLGKCEQFFLELMKVPRVESKLRVFSFKMEFSTQVNDLRNHLNVVNSAAVEVKNSSKLKRVMQTILSLGNAMNHGTARGSAIGFRLDSLLKLTDTRARNNKMTLMHYLCKVIAEKLPELLEFPKDLVSLEAASKVQLKFLAEEMQAIHKGLEKVEQELTASENDGAISEEFCKRLRGFLGSAEAEVRSLASIYSVVGRNADALAHYFGEDPVKCPFEQVVSTLLNFTRMFERAHTENCNQAEQEKKKAQKDAQDEMLKSTREESEQSTENPTLVANRFVNLF